MIDKDMILPMAELTLLCIWLVWMNSYTAMRELRRSSRQMERQRELEEQLRKVTMLWRLGAPFAESLAGDPSNPDTPFVRRP